MVVGRAIGLVMRGGHVLMLAAAPGFRVQVARSALQQVGIALAHAQQQAAAQAAAEESGDPPLPFAAGQLTVEVGAQVHCVYRLVGSLYVVGLSPPGDHHRGGVGGGGSNIFEAVGVVNSTALALVRLCGGNAAEVTPQRLQQSYLSAYNSLTRLLRKDQTLLQPSITKEGRSVSGVKDLWVQVGPGLLAEQEAIHRLEEQSFELPPSLVPKQPTPQEQGALSQEVDDVLGDFLTNDASTSAAENGDAAQATAVTVGAMSGFGAFDNFSAAQGPNGMTLDVCVCGFLVGALQPLRRGCATT